MSSAFSPPAASVEQEILPPSLVQQESVTKAKPTKADSPKKRTSKSDQVLLVQSELPDPLLRRASTSSMPESEVGDYGSDGARSPAYGSDGARSPAGEESTLRSSISSCSTAGVVKELKTFRQFLKPRYGTPGEAYDSLLGFSTVLDEKTFMVRMEELNYMGNSERLFFALNSAGNGTITREAFKEHLVAVARLPQPKKKSISFGAVVLHAVQSIKDVDLEDTWDPTPLDEDTAQMPPIEILIDEAEESRESKPKATEKETTDFVAITKVQPSASGQPATGDQGRLRAYSDTPSEESRGDVVEHADVEGTKAKRKSPSGKAAAKQLPSSTMSEACRNKKRRESGGGMFSPGRKGARRNSLENDKATKLGGMLSPGRKGVRRNSEKGELDKSPKAGGEAEEEGMTEF